MDYNYFGAAGGAPPSYQYMSFGDNSFAGVVQDANVHPTSMDPSVNAQAFLQNTYAYNPLDPSMGASTGLTPLPAKSVSPRSQHISMTPNGSAEANNLPETEEQLHERRRSSSEEKESLTPAQSRRKAQNRAAQRAFRERKERHVRDLEAKLNLLTSTTTSLQSDNERLKLMLQRAQTENEILRASAASSSPPSYHTPNFVDDRSLFPASRRKTSATPSSASLFRFNANPAFSTGASSPSKISSSSPASDNLLSASAAWDLLQSHPLYLSGTLDIGEVCERLKKMARSDGVSPSPVFDEEEVRKVLEQLGHGAGDERI